MVVSGVGADLTDSHLPAGRRKKRPRFADTVVLCGAGPDKRVIVCEIQTSFPSTRQRYRQHGYLANAADFHLRKGILHIITIDPKVARRCGLPFWPGHPDLVLIPIVSGPHNTPLPGAPGAAEFVIELTVLGVLNSNLDLADPATRRSVTETLALPDFELRKEYNELIWTAANTEIHKPLETDMNMSSTIPFVDTALKEGYAQGKSQGKADLVLRQLGARGLAVSAAEEQRIRSCTDAAELDDWGIRVMSAVTTADIFADAKAGERAA
jgi:hypothetical protein